GSPDELRGTIVKAFIILAPGYTASDALVKEIQDHVKKETAPYKYPREIEFLDALPKTVSGKIRRVELRKLEEERKSGKK
ncbi:MAG: acyl-CoA synthetase, partial [Deltaproteobacteria bacterium]|nr:acyl-CoA synthetase [Deltaproteobacteria bacterium]